MHPKPEAHSWFLLQGFPDTVVRVPISLWKSWKMGVLLIPLANTSSNSTSFRWVSLPHAQYITSLYCLYCSLLFLLAFYFIPNAFLSISLLPVTFIFPFPYWSCGILLPQNILASAAVVSEIPARGFALRDCPGQRACQHIPTGNQKVVPAQQWATSRMCSSVFLKY